MFHIVLSTKIVFDARRGAQPLCHALFCVRILLGNLLDPAFHNTWLRGLGWSERTARPPALRTGYLLRHDGLTPVIVRKRHALDCQSLDSSAESRSEAESDGYTADPLGPKKDQALDHAVALTRLNTEHKRGLAKALAKLKKHNARALRKEEARLRAEFEQGLHEEKLVLQNAATAQLRKDLGMKAIKRSGRVALSKSADRILDMTAEGAGKGS